MGWGRRWEEQSRADDVEVCRQVGRAERLGWAGRTGWRWYWRWRWCWWYTVLEVEAHAGELREEDRRCVSVTGRYLFTV